MLFKEDPDFDKAVKQGNVLALFNYLPYGKRNNRMVADQGTLKPIENSPISLKILGVKQSAKQGLEDWKKKKSKEAVHFFLGVLKKMIGSLIENVTDTLHIAVLPSSTKDNKEHGISAFTQALCKAVEVPFEPQLLMRAESVDKAATGGLRDAEVHAATIAVNANSVKEGHKVLIIDDVTTSGSSRGVVLEKLKQEGVSMVRFLAFGKTLPSADYFAYEKPEDSPTMAAKFQGLLSKLFSPNLVKIAKLNGCMLCQMSTGEFRVLRQQRVAAAAKTKALAESKEVAESKDEESKSDSETAEAALSGGVK